MDALLIQRDPSGLARALRERRLYKRALDLPASDVPDDLPAGLWTDADRLERVADALAAHLGVAPGGVLIDYPERTSMLQCRLPLRTRDARTERLTDVGRAGELGLPRVANELYRSARRLRIFTGEP